MTEETIGDLPVAALDCGSAYVAALCVETAGAVNRSQPADRRRLIHVDVKHV